MHFGPIVRPKCPPKGANNEAQHESTSNTNNNIRHEGFQVLLGSAPVLGRFWVDLGVNIYEFAFVLYQFGEHRVFEEDKAWKGILDGSWVDFETKTNSTKT